MKRFLLTLAGVLLVSHAPSVQATILLNEVHLRTPPSTDATPADGNHEFVELKSTTGGVEACTDLWILVIENDGTGVGEIKQAWPLFNTVDGATTTMSTGANGLLLLGDDYIRPDDNPYQFIKARQTTLGDPDGMGPDDFSDTNALCVLLVSGYTNPAPLPGAADVDIDMDDDGTGVFDWADPTPPANRYTAPLWSAIVDSVGFNGDRGSVIKITYSVANLSRTNAFKGVPQAGSTTANFLPHTLARNATDNTANSRSAWYGGTVSGTSGDSVTYGASFFNLVPGAGWKGLVTPGQPNLSSAPVPPVFRLNEINLNPSSVNDGNFEYVEIVNTVASQAGGSNFSGSLANYTLLVVDSGGITLGKIREAWNLNKFATGSNGVLMLGDNYPDGTSPFAGMVDPTTQYADPSETAAQPPNQLKFTYSNLSAGDLGNNGVTLFLVTGWNGLVDDDIDSDDNGALNTTLPWTGVIDSVSVPSLLNNALVANQGGYSPAKPDIVVAGKHYNADNLSRIQGNIDANVTAAWSAGVFGSNSPYGLAYRNGYNVTGSGTAFRGAASPGKANYNSALPPVAGTFRINEVHIDPPTDPDDTEYVEVIGPAPHALMTDMWLIVLDATPGGSGVVKKVIDLRGQATGANRLAIFSDGIEEPTDAFNFPVLLLSPRTVADDPKHFQGDGTEVTASGFNFGDNSIEPNNGVSVLLVTYTAPNSAGVPANPGTPLDANNDGVLDATPSWALVDGVSTGNGVGGVPALPATGVSPGNVCRYATNMDANSASAWFGGELTGNTAISFDYSNNFFGTFKGAASPGRQNVVATPNNAVGLLLNEININPPGGDNDKEFVELRSVNNAAMSTNGYSVLLIDNDGADTGRVMEVWELDGAATGANGLLLTGVGYDIAVPWTGAGAPETATKLFAPESMAFDDIGVNTDNGALTVLLVKNFKGRAGDDLDQGTNANPELADDQVFNPPLPWETQADSVAMKGFALPDPDAVPPLGYRLEGSIFHDLSGIPVTADLTVLIPAVQANGYTPDTVARFAGNSAANNSAAWYGANILGTAGTSTAYDTVQYFPTTLGGDGKITPGQINIAALSDSSDPDNDGVVHLMETALGMDTFTPDAHKLPQPSMLTANNVVQPAFTVVRPSGGVAGITYTVQASFNLQTWTLPTTLLYTTPGPSIETQVFLVDSNFLPLLDINKRVYFRLKVQR